MIQENEVAARLADAFHFFHDRDGIRNGGNEISGKNAIEAGVGKFEAGGVHLHEADVAEAQLLGAFAGFVEHSLGEVDAGEFDIAGKKRKGESRANTHFQKVSSREEIKQFRAQLTATLKD